MVRRGLACLTFRTPPKTPPTAYTRTQSLKGSNSLTCCFRPFIVQLFVLFYFFSIDCWRASIKYLENVHYLHMVFIKSTIPRCRTSLRCKRRLLSKSDPLFHVAAADQCQGQWTKQKPDPLPQDSPLCGHHTTTPPSWHLQVSVDIPMPDQVVSFMFFRGTSWTEACRVGRILGGSGIWTLN